MISWGDIGGKRKPSRFTPVSPTPSFAIRAERRKTKRVKRGEIHHILRTAYQKWQWVRFKMGGANLNFEVRLRGEIINKKYKKIPRESA